MSGTERYAPISNGNSTVPMFDTKRMATGSILVIDDDELVRSFLCDALKTENYDVESAENCDQAQERIAEKSFDVILCDINLPGMSGEEFLPFCKKTYPCVEIILITGQPGIDDAVHAVKDGAFDYLPKPISPEKLFNRVSAAMDASTQCEIRRVSADNGSPAKGYKIVRNLGSGTMGVVLLVSKDDEYYAMKILRSEMGGLDSDRKLQRFSREAEILTQINHPNIVRFFEYGVSPKDNVPYFVMEFVAGQPLSLHIENGDLQIHEKLHIVKQIASALAFIHERGIIHRDVKPANILVTGQKEVKLSDFGIARIADSDLTITHEMLGSPAYMSPEAFDASKKKDQRSDIFSLGTICYELLTGIKPFSGETITELMDSIRHDKPIEPMRLSLEIRPYIQDILAKMLAKAPDDRFASASDIVKAFDKEHVESPESSITSRLLRTLLLRKPTWR